MVTYTSTFLAAANLLAIASAAPAHPVCQVVVNVYKGAPIWVPNDPGSSATWSVWDPKETSTTTTSTWSAWDPKDSTTTTTSTWSDWSDPADSTSTTTAGWGSWTDSATSKTTTTWSYPGKSTSTTWSTPYPTTTPSTTKYTTPYTTPSTTPYTTPSTTPSTTTAKPAPTCDSSSYSFNASPAGSCGCSFTVDCNQHASYTQDTKFWERNNGELIDTLAQCVEICNSNSACEATVWSAKDGTSAQDYKRCWQISGLGQPDSNGYGQISYKGSCSGSCSANYNKTPGS